MKKIRDRLNEPGSGLFLYLIVVIALISLIFINGLRSFNSQKKAESSQQQLVAICGAVAEALWDAGIEEEDVNIFLRWLDKEDLAINIALNRKQTTYVIHDGKIVIHKPSGREVLTIKKTWQDYPDFHSLIKK